MSIFEEIRITHIFVFLLLLEIRRIVGIANFIKDIAISRLRNMLFLNAFRIIVTPVNGLSFLLLKLYFFSLELIDYSLQSLIFEFGLYFPFD